MKTYHVTIFLGILLLAACSPSPTSTPAAELVEAIPSATKASTPLPQGKTVIVTSTYDYGPGSLRQALLEAQPCDTITFDPALFSPDSPAVIAITSALPWLSQGYVTIDASNAGVVLDGSLIQGGWTPGLTIDSEGNTVQGLQIINFTGAGIILWETAPHNIIGGDPHNGSGPFGQGNLIGGNSDGIGLRSAGYNTITGNLIGVDIDGTSQRGNLGTGIFLEGVAKGNVIGPDNEIAFTVGGHGIDIRSIEIEGTTITQNYLHDNAAAIRIVPRGLSTPIPPVILDFDLEAGTVSGVTCPSCVVEVFSGSSAAAGVYQGSVTADPQGAFTLHTPRPLSGPSLMATSTMTDGSTSTFSIPTTGIRGPDKLLQEGNDLPVTLFYARSSEDLEDNRIGSHTDFHREEYELALHEMAGLGLKRIRLTFNEMELPIDHNRPDFSIGQKDDDWIDSIIDRGIEISYIISYWDKQYQADGGVLPCSRFQTEDEIERYLDYVRLVVNHLKDRVQYYEIWNEPDANTCTQRIEPQDYVDLVHRVVPVIRQEYPEAKIAVGAVSGLHSPDIQKYLMAIAGSDIMPIVDVISWHPFYGASPAYADVAEYYNTYPSLVQQIKTLASASGFDGEYRADELTWRIPAFKNPDHPWTSDEISAAKYYARSIVLHLGMDVSPGVDFDSRVTTVYSTVRNLSTVMAGLLRPINLPVEIQSKAASIISYGFTYPNGDKLFAVWTNGTAVNYDPGVTATLTFPGLSAQKVVAVDVLQGFEQELLITNTESGDLGIPNLLVKDYPILIKFIDVGSVDIPEQTPQITPTIESAPGLTFTGTWQGSDPYDASITSLILTQTGDQIEGTYSDTFTILSNGTLVQPGFSGQGSGYLVSPTEAKMVFNLTRSDGASIQIDVSLFLSLQDATVTLEVPQQSYSIVLFLEQ